MTSLEKHNGMKGRYDHWRFDLLGGCFGIAIALGLVRFDFGILGRLMAEAKWISIEQVGQLAAINMLGYLAGSIQQAYLKSQKVSIRFVKLSLIIVIISILMEGHLRDFTSQSVLRFLCGWGAAHIVSGLPTIALQRVPLEINRSATGIIMSGGGIGALIGSLAIGMFSPTSAPSAWTVLLLSTLILSLPVFILLYRNVEYSQNFNSTSNQPVNNLETKSSSSNNPRFLIAVIILGFAFMQIGQVPTILYEPLIAMNKLNLVPRLASNLDGLFGLGLIIGGIIPALVPSKLTTKLFLPLISLFGLLGVVFFANFSNIFELSISILLIGVWDMMTGTLTYHRFGQICSKSTQRRAWATATSVGAIGFILFSSSTSQFSGSNINLILNLGILAVAIQFILEITQYALSAKEKFVD